ncbi:MAG: glycosyltransferase, partial [Chitinophagaceae bacterium]|nr:glycosyltransferase [Chitinophagaceae bacterium]
NTNPLENRDSFLSNFTSGVFSAGFFGVNKKGLPALTWWANACHFMMGPHIELGVHDDQRYLDIFPVLFENTKIIRHRGCNVGAWNYGESVRSLVNGQVLIKGSYPVIFIHFDEMLIATILKGHDKYLLPYLERYRKYFEEEGYELSGFIRKLDQQTNAGLLLRMKWKIQFRTRIKKFLYKLAERL